MCVCVCVLVCVCLCACVTVVIAWVYLWWMVRLQSVGVHEMTRTESESGRWKTWKNLEWSGFFLSPPTPTPTHSPTHSLQWPNYRFHFQQLPLVDNQWFPSPPEQPRPLRVWLHDVCGDVR